eukprot:1158375-Pelagomonas_calceolata.AAC.10
MGRLKKNHVQSTPTVLVWRHGCQKGRAVQGESLQFPPSPEWVPAPKSTPGVHALQGECPWLLACQIFFLEGAQSCVVVGICFLKTARSMCGQERPFKTSSHHQQQQPHPQQQQQEEASTSEAGTRKHESRRKPAQARPALANMEAAAAAAAVVAAACSRKAVNHLHCQSSPCYVRFHGQYVRGSMHRTAGLHRQGAGGQGSAPLVLLMGSGTEWARLAVQVQSAASWHGGKTRGVEGAGTAPLLYHPWNQAWKGQDQRGSLPGLPSRKLGAQELGA